MFLRPRKPSRKFWKRFGLSRLKRRRNLGKLLMRPYPHVLHTLLRLHNLFLHRLRFQQKLGTLMMMMMMRRRVLGVHVSSQEVLPLWPGTSWENLYTPFFLPSQAEEIISRDEKGRLLKNGKIMSDAAVDQRLRRWCTKKKGGGLKCAQDIYDRYHTLGVDARNELVEVFKAALLNKDSCFCFHYFHDFWLLPKTF